MTEILSIINAETFIAILTALVTIWIFEKGNGKEIAKERLEKVISPCYEILYPHFYKPFNSDVRDAFERAKSIIEKEPLLAGGVIRTVFENQPFDGNHRDIKYDNLCRTLDSEYHRLCKKVGIPVRSWYDRRIKGKVCKSLGSFVHTIFDNLLYVIKEGLLGLILIACVTVLLLYIKYIFESINIIKSNPGLIWLIILPVLVTIANKR